MKTYNQYLNERSEEEISIVKSFNNAINSLGNVTGMIGYLNKPMKKTESEVRKIAPKPILKPSSDSYKRFNLVRFGNGMGGFGGQFKLNITRVSDNEFEYKFAIEANFRSISYIGSKTWRPYTLFVVVRVDNKGNVLDIIRYNFAIDGALRKSVKLPWRKGDVSKLIRTMLDVIAAEAGKDLILDAKFAAKQSQEMR